MLLIIHNLPADTSYADVKSLIHSKCGLTDVILDNLMSQDSAGKKVTVGVTDEHDAAIIIGKINGIFINGHQLVVENRQKKPVEPVESFNAPAVPPLRQPKMYTNNTASYAALNPVVCPPANQNPAPILTQNPNMGYGFPPLNTPNMPYYMSNQNPYTGYGTQPQQAQSSYSSQQAPRYSYQNPNKQICSNMPNYQSNKSDFQSNTTGYQSDNKGYVSNTADYQTNMSGYQSKPPDYKSNNSYQSNNPYQLNMLGYQTNTAGNQYNAPGNQYNMPGNQYNTPGNQYNMPGNQHNTTSKPYNTPSIQYNTPGNQHNMTSKPYNTPSNQYNTPGNQHNTSGNRYNTPINQYNKLGNQSKTPDYQSDTKKPDAAHLRKDEYDVEERSCNNHYDKWDSENKMSRKRKSSEEPSTSLGNTRNSPQQHGSGSSNNFGLNNKPGSYTINNSLRAGGQCTKNPRDQMFDTKNSGSGSGLSNVGIGASQAKGSSPKSGSKKRSRNRPKRPDPKDSVANNLRSPKPGFKNTASPALKRHAIDPWQHNHNESRPAKRPRPPIPTRYTKFSKRPGKALNKLKNVLASDNKKRNIVSKYIVSEILKSSSNEQIKAGRPLQLLHKCIRARIEIALGCYVSVDPPEIMALYRTFFQERHDEQLCEAIVTRAANEDPAEEEKALQPRFYNPVQFEVSSQNYNIDEEEDPQEDPRIRLLPPYLGGDKKQFKLMKKQMNLDSYTPFEEMFEGSDIPRRLVEEEVAALVEVVKSVYRNPTTEAEEIICRYLHHQKVGTDSSEPRRRRGTGPLEHIENTLRSEVAKRLFNICSRPAVRIMGAVNSTRKPLEEFLLNKGVVSLKKADRQPFYVAHMDSYRSLDKLLEFQKVSICGRPIKFMPLHVTQKPKLSKSLRAELQKKQTLSQTQPSTSQPAAVFKKPADVRKPPPGPSKPKSSPKKKSKAQTNVNKASQNNVANVNKASQSNVANVNKASQSNVAAASPNETKAQHNLPRGTSNNTLKADLDSNIVEKNPTVGGQEAQGAGSKTETTPISTVQLVEGTTEANKAQTHPNTTVVDGESKVVPNDISCKVEESPVKVSPSAGDIEPPIKTEIKIDDKTRPSVTAEQNELVATRDSDKTKRESDWDDYMNMEDADDIEVDDDDLEDY
ncbi:uncharacterized protein LOC114241106 [Bombyx mandarina]|uniref:Uncharacterized protein LOC114241106 n=1 Tax=Bombyx mandarina TaxID=7092 RepID=A0A6J2JDT4_BOMMA|nr:uncharacterized protein LOC114241106 [Bombyx mandarina]